LNIQSRAFLRCTVKRHFGTRHPRRFCFLRAKAQGGRPTARIDPPPRPRTRPSVSPELPCYHLFSLRIPFREAKSYRQVQFAKKNSSHLTFTKNLQLQALSLLDAESKLAIANYQEENIL
jgi:hypothetical protein